MRKFLTTGLFGAILGLLVGAPADASLISRSFLDQALTDYATTTALDLKANKSDFTDLSNKIGDAWPYWSDMSPGLISLSWGLYPLEITLENVSDLVRFLFGGALESGINQGGVLNLLGESVFNTGAYDINTGQIDDGFRSLLQLTNGWTDSQKKTYLGVKGLNDKIGTLPEGVTVQGMYEGWIGNNGLHTLGLQELELDSFYTYNPENDSPQLLKGQKGGLLSVLSPLLRYSDEFVGFNGELASFWKLTQSAYKTDELSAKIGTLPRGSLLNQTRFTDVLYNMIQGTESPVYPNSMAELVKQIYGEFSSSGNQPGLVHILITGFPNNGILPVNSDEIGILPAMSLAETANSVANTANETAQANAAKIGTLPSGRLHMRLPGFSIFESAGIRAPFNYPTSLSDLFLYLFGSNEDTTKDGLFPVIGTWVRDISAQIDSINITSNAIQSKIGTVPDGKNLAGMISETNAKIGDLPTEYETVGAALTAIKGIAEDAKAAALAAIPDPKTEGSTGKYVLTVDIVGDNATYRWEKIDREGETTTTTE